MTSSWMLVAGFLFAAMGVFVKLGADHFGTPELAFYRSLVTMTAALAVLAHTRVGVKSPHLGTHFLRGFVGALSLVGYFYALARLPLATAQMLNYTSPLFLAITTMVVMGERFSGWLVAAIALGFVGVLLLLQPNFESGKETAALVGLFSGVLAAWAYLSVRALGRLGEPDWRVLFWFGAISTVVCALWQVTTASFHALRWDNAWIIVGIGASGTLGQLAMTRAYRTGSTLVVGALSYSTVVFGIFMGMLLWADMPSPIEWLGMGVIVVSGVMAMRVEKKEQIEEAGFEG